MIGVEIGREPARLLHGVERRRLFAVGAERGGIPVPRLGVLWVERAGPGELGARGRDVVIAPEGDEGERAVRRDEVGAERDRRFRRRSRRAVGVGTGKGGIFAQQQVRLAQPGVGRGGAGIAGDDRAELGPRPLEARRGAQVEVVGGGKIGVFGGGVVEGWVRRRCRRTQRDRSADHYDDRDAGDGGIGAAARPGHRSGRRAR